MVTTKKKKNFWLSWGPVKIISGPAPVLSPRSQVHATPFSVNASDLPGSRNLESKIQSRTLGVQRKQEDPWSSIADFGNAGPFGAAVYGVYVLHIVCTLQLASSDSCMYCLQVLYLVGVFRKF